MIETEEIVSDSARYSRKSRQAGKRRRPNPNVPQLNYEFRDHL